MVRYAFTVAAVTAASALAFACNRTDDRANDNRTGVTTTTGAALDASVTNTLPNTANEPMGTTPVTGSDVPSSNEPLGTGSTTGSPSRNLGDIDRPGDMAGGNTGSTTNAVPNRAGTATGTDTTGHSDMAKAGAPTPVNRGSVDTTRSSDHAGKNRDAGAR